jgi:hypothetical protein
MYFEKKKNESREPHETAAVSKNIVAGLWSSKDGRGRQSFRFALYRIDGVRWTPKAGQEKGSD